MKIPTIVTAALAAGLLATAIGAQETKPVPKDSVRVRIPGCTKGYIFTAGRRTEENPGSVDVPEGMHIRMNGPKKMMEEIKRHEGSMIEITGLMKKGQYGPGGVNIGGGVRVGPATGSPNGGIGSPVAGQVSIDLEGWRQIAGDCSSH